MSNSENRNQIIASNIKKYIKEKGMTQKELAKEVGISPSTMSDYMNLRSNPSHGVIQRIANFFGVLKTDIDSTYKEKSDITNIYNQLNQGRQLRVYNFAKNQLEEQNKKKTVLTYGQTAAGEPIVYSDDIVEEKEVSNIPKGADCALVVRGDSMEPEFHDGSVVFYKSQPALDNGEIGVFEIDGEAVTMKRIEYDYDNKKILLQSLNKKYEDLIFKNDQIRILGKVVK